MSLCASSTTGNCPAETMLLRAPLKRTVRVLRATAYFKRFFDT
jgi:hypothetical protein